MRRRRDPKTLSRFGTVGAWLGVWTPPRGVEVPPVPWRRLLLWAGAVAVAAGAALAVAVPAIDGAKDERSARDARTADARAVARRAGLEREQAPRSGRVPAGSRNDLLAAVAAHVGRDARARFDPDATAATCEPAAGVPPRGGREALDCLAPVRSVLGAGNQAGARGVLGIPYRAVVDPGRGTYVFCKTNPPPGEQIVPDPRTLVQLPAACRAP